MLKCKMTDSITVCFFFPLKLNASFAYLKIKFNLRWYKQHNCLERKHTYCNQYSFDCTGKVPHKLCKKFSEMQLIKVCDKVISIIMASILYSECFGNILNYQFSSVAQSCPTLCDPMNRSTPGLPVHHQLPEFTQIHVHRVSNAIQPSRPRSSPSPPAPVPPSIRVFSEESTLRMRWPKCWSFSFSIIPSKEIPGLISFRQIIVSEKLSERLQVLKFPFYLYILQVV